MGLILLFNFQLSDLHYCPILCCIQEASVNPINNARILPYFKMKINPVQTTSSKFELQLPRDHLLTRQRVKNFLKFYEK